MLGDPRRPVAVLGGQRFQRMQDHPIPEAEQPAASDRLLDILRRYALLPAIQARPVLLLDAVALVTTHDARNTGGSEFRLLCAR